MFGRVSSYRSPPVQRFITRLTVYWLAALATVVLLLVVSHLMLSDTLRQQEQEIALVRLSGRQRVYSQQIALLSLQLATSPDLAKRAGLRGELSAAVGNMRRDHQQLLSFSRLQPQLESHYSGAGSLDARVTVFLDAAGRLVNLSGGELSLDHPDLRLVQDAAPGLLDDLSAVVGIYQAVSLERARALDVANQARAVVILLVLAAQGWFVIRPMMRRLRDEAGQLTAEIAERQRAETEVRAKQHFIEQVAASIPDIIFVYDVSSQQIVYSNHSLANLLGYTLEDFQAMGADVLALVIHPDDLPRVLARNERYPALAEGERLMVEYRARHQAGHWVWLQGISTVFAHDAAGQALQILIVARDITPHKEGKQHELDLQVERARMRFLREFVTNISHDFRTPLAIINSSAYLISKLPDEGRRQEKVNIIGKQVERLDHLLTQVLFTARLDNSDEYQMSRVHLNELIENTLSSLSPVSRRQHQIGVQVADFNIVLDGNPALLERALINLLENALAYTPAGGSITLSAGCIGEQCILEIRDTGIGIAAADLPRIFEPFYRADQARATSTGGMGLGLTMVKKIVDLHRGDIRIDSQPGQGTTVRLLIPLAAAMQPI